MTEKIPQGFHTVTPHLTVHDAAGAIEFYKKAFGACECGRMPTPDGKKVIHASLTIGDSPFMLNDEFGDGQNGCRSPKALGGSPVTLHLYVDDADAVFNQAVQAGAEVVMPMEDAFWGDRYGQVRDPFGHTWSIATHVRDVSPDEMATATQGVGM